MRLKPVTIKDFKVGQKIAVLILHHGRNKEPELYERTVSRIGRRPCRKLRVRRKGLYLSQNGRGKRLHRKI